MRSWQVTRFRGMLNTQPGSAPEASFKIVALEAVEHNVGPSGASNSQASACIVGNDCGPFGEQDDEQVIKLVQPSDRVYVQWQFLGVCSKSGA